MFSSEGGEDQRDIGRAAIFRTLRRQYPFANQKEVRKKEYVSTRVSDRLASRFGSEVDGNI